MISCIAVLSELRLLLDLSKKTTHVVSLIKTIFLLFLCSGDDYHRIPHTLGLGRPVRASSVGTRQGAPVSMKTTGRSGRPGQVIPPLLVYVSSCLHSTCECYVSWFFHMSMQLLLQCNNGLSASTLGNRKIVMHIICVGICILPKQNIFHVQRNKHI